MTTLLIAALPLTSCGLFAKALGVPTDCERTTDDVPFATSDRILRGAWEGTAEGLSVTGETRTVELDLTASRVDEDRYEITGTFALEGDASARIDGTVSGGCAGGTPLWRVSAYGPVYAGNLLQEGTLVLDIASVTDRDVRGQATIARVEEP